MRRDVAIVAAVIVVAALPACKPSPDTSGSVLRPPAGPTGPLPNLTISGPTTIPPGSTAQFHATVKSTDGSSQDVTSTVTWNSSDTSILTIDAGGVAIARQSGDITIVALLDARSSAITAVTVIPPGTFKLQGTVIWQNNRVEGAAVQVSAGTGTGLAATTDSSGAYRLYGVAGAIEVTVSKPSYVTIRQTATITSNTTLGFQLQASSPLPQFAGTYTLQITADPACTVGAGQEAFPSVARVRRYTATFDNQPNGLSARMTDANFIADKNVIWGSVRPDGAAMDVNHLDYYYGFDAFPPPDFGEILPDGDVYCPSGSITLTASGQGFTGVLAGTLKIRRPSGTTVSQCASAHHSVSFTLQNANRARTGLSR